MSVSSTPRSPRRGALLGGLLALAALLGALFGEAVHGLLEPHRYCTAHDAIEHGANHGTDSTRPAEGSEGPHLAAEGGEDEHELCRIAAFANDEHALEVAEPAFAGSVWIAPAAAPHDAPRASSIPRYRLAPKQSPPVA